MRHRTVPFLLVLAVLFSPSALRSQRAQSRYALILEDPPLAAAIPSRKELKRAAAEDHLRRLETAQLVLRDELNRRGLRVTGAVQTLANAVFVQASRDRLEELRRLPGVKGVTELRPVRPHLDRAAGLVNAPAAWGVLGNENAGMGVKIGILDSGIDPTHPAFQDELLTPPAGFPKCVGNDCAYTNKKVIVARSYVSMLAAGFTLDPSETSRPDDLSPRDRVGHGTAAAMIAAGKQNAGPSATITGIAPKAFLGNYKVFGSPGVNDYTFEDVVIKALEDAFLDGMDIVSLSLGIPAAWGPRDTGATCGNNPGVPCDFFADAVRQAVAKGMNVVVSAGNDGDVGEISPTLNTIATPGTEPDAITAGASTNSHVFYASVRVTGSDVPANLQRINALFGDGPPLASAFTRPLRDVAALGNDGKACSALPAGSLNGAIALVLRGDCFFEVKVSNARAAGAEGVIIVRDGATDFPFQPRGLLATSIPAVMIGGNPGQELKTFLATHLDRPVTLDPALTGIEATADSLADFSSRGPAIGTFGVKPEVVAVGTGIYTATQKYDPNSDMYNPSGYGAYSGTSFSAPMVAGGAALVKQWKPALNPAQVKSAIVNTAARPTGTGIASESVTGIGAGKLNLAEAIRPLVSAVPATLSFGLIGTGMLPQQRTVRLTNTGGGIVNLQLSVVERTNDPNTELQVVPNNVPLSPGGFQDVELRISGTQPIPGSYEGEIVVQGAGAANFRIPYYYVVGNNTPHIIYPLLGDGFEGVVGQPLPRWLALKLTDRYGVPVQGIPVTFRPPAGGAIEVADGTTDVYGIAAARVRLGSQLGEQTFTAEAGGLSVSFFGTARLRPTINSNGIENAGSFEPATTQKGVAPGSYIAIKGQALSPTTLAFATPYLPLALANVSVSFDIPSAGVSLPGRIHFVHPTQINVQIPWELEGYNSVRVKVSIGDVSGAVFDLPLARNSPAFFEYPLNSGIPAGYEFMNPNPVGVSNPVARGAIVQLYCNGLGPVTNRPASGEPTQGAPLSQVVDSVTATIGGQPATVEFKGMTPTAIGLYQVNLRVPTNISAGSHPLVLTVNGVAAKTVNLPVK